MAVRPSLPLRTIVLATVLGLCSAAPLSAQSYVYEVFIQDPLSRLLTGVRERTWINGELSDIQRQTTLGGLPSGSPVVTFDGRFVVWLHIPSSRPPGSDPAIAFVDRITGAAGVLPGIFVPQGTLFADPRAMRLYVLSGNGITVVEATGTEFIPLPVLGFPSAFSEGGTELYFAINAADGALDKIVALTRTTFRILSEVPTGVHPSTLTVSRDGRRLYLTSSAPGSVAVHVLDADTGAELSRREMSAPDVPWAGINLGPAAADERNARLLVPITRWVNVPYSVTGSLWMLDLVTLNVLAEASTDNHAVSAIHVDETQATILSFGSVFGRPVGCGSGRAHIWAESLTPIRSVDTGVCADTAVASPPVGPSELQYTRTGRRVTLSWTAGLRSPDFVIEAGSAPGAADVATFRTNGLATVTVDNVPAGTYYVRAYAVNAVGQSPASNDLTVVVP